MASLPEDESVFEHELQFLLGSEILVAPYTEPCDVSMCTFEQEVYLPEIAGFTCGRKSILVE